MYVSRFARVHCRYVVYLIMARRARSLIAHSWAKAVRAVSGKEALSGYEVFLVAIASFLEDGVACDSAAPSGWKYRSISRSRWRSCLVVVRLTLLEGGIFNCVKYAFRFSASYRLWLTASGLRLREGG